MDTQVECYYFDVDKCKPCPFKDGCYKDGAKSKTYSVKIKSDTHTAQMDYMATEEFKEYYSHRYKIETKNAEIKNVYNYDKSSECGKSGMTIQGATTLVLTNLNKIYRLEDEKERKISKNHTIFPSKFLFNQKNRPFSDFYDLVDFICILFSGLGKKTLSFFATKIKLHF